jgi:hypothetical protein
LCFFNGNLIIENGKLLPQIYKYFPSFGGAGVVVSSPLEGAVVVNCELCV